MPKLSPIHWRRLEKIVLSCGCRFISQEGSHRKYDRVGLARPVVIPTYKEVPVFIIRENLLTLGLSREEYLHLLQTV